MAIDEKKVDIEQALLDFFPEYQQSDRHEKSQISIKHVLNMELGVNLDEWRISSVNPNNDFYRLQKAMHLIKDILSTEFIDTAPNMRFRYTGAATVLLSTILEKIYHQPFETIVDQKLFSPLGIIQKKWLKYEGSGKTAVDYGLHLSPRDMQKIGHFFLNKGQWKTKQLVAAHWFDTIILDDRPNRLSSRPRYRLHFWQLPKPEGSYMAEGWGGQTIFVDPEQQLVITTTANNNESNLRAMWSYASTLANEWRYILH